MSLYGIDIGFLRLDFIIQRLKSLRIFLLALSAVSIVRDQLFNLINKSGKPETPGKNYMTLFSKQYYEDYYGDRETYARYMANFRTYAVITPDGKWYAEGNMGWFGCSSATPEEFKKWCEHYKEIFLDNADPDWILTIVDCHI